jgi:hypothetical protein
MSEIILTEGSTPSAPDSGKIIIYCDTSGSLLFLLRQIQPTQSDTWLAT